MTTHFGITGNFMRYAHDFAIADAQGRLYRSDGATPQDWYGFGAPIFAVADGSVVEIHDGMADNRKGGPPAFTQDEIMRNIKCSWELRTARHGNASKPVRANAAGSVRVSPATAGGVATEDGCRASLSRAPAYQCIRPGSRKVYRRISTRRVRTVAAGLPVEGPVDSGRGARKHSTHHVTMLAERPA